MKKSTVKSILNVLLAGLIGGVFFTALFGLFYVVGAVLSLVFTGLDGFWHYTNGWIKPIEREPATVFLAPFALSFSYVILGFFAGAFKK